MSLGKLGRKVYVSQRGLEQILADLREQESSLKGTSRKSIKRARDKETASFTTTAFGQVLVNMTFFKPNGEEMKLPILHPAECWRVQRRAVRPLHASLVNVWIVTSQLQ